MTSGARSVEVLGGAITTAGIALFVGATQIPSGFGYDVVGPAAFPKIIATGLTLSGLLTLLHARKGGPAGLIEPLGSGRVAPVAIISGAILLLAALVASLGWVPTAALVFLAGTWAFGDRRIVLNAAIGLGMGLVTLLVFNWGLGLDLPLGILSALPGITD